MGFNLVSGSPIVYPLRSRWSTRYLTIHPLTVQDVGTLSANMTPYKGIVLALYLSTGRKYGLRKCSSWINQHRDLAIILSELNPSLFKSPDEDLCLNIPEQRIRAEKHYLSQLMDFYRSVWAEYHITPREISSMSYEQFKVVTTTWQDDLKDLGIRTIDDFEKLKGEVE